MTDSTHIQTPEARASALLNAREAAAVAGVSVTRLIVDLALGRLVAEKRGREWYITRQSIMDYMRATKLRMSLPSDVRHSTLSPSGYRA